MSRRIGTVVVATLVAAWMGLVAPGAAGAAASAGRSDRHHRGSFDDGLSDSDLFARLDANRNGSVSWAEWRQFDTAPEARADFEALDTDRDERINRDEWASNVGRTRVVVHLFTYLDAQREEPAGANDADRTPTSAIVSLTF
ncbi:MAG TPA: hypothetical protein VMS22_09785 [Candidatus Eisenbacteria bacterium]|nr:hypothetical protein [Candidatus Eisenbacteria bacterium]